jgi:arylsulfatase A-like enzyme
MMKNLLASLLCTFACVFSGFTQAAELEPFSHARLSGSFVQAIDCNGSTSQHGDAAFLPAESAARFEGKVLSGKSRLNPATGEPLPGFLATWVSVAQKPLRLRADASTGARDLVPGQRYRLQLFFGGGLPGKNERRTAVEVEGAVVATDLLLGRLTAPSVLSHIAQDTTLDLGLVPTSGSAFLSAFTVEALAPEGMAGAVGTPRPIAAAKQAPAVPRPALDPAKHPNVLFIIVDDLNDYTGYLGGHPDARTPNIDRLAQRGTAFLNGHTAAPVCNPSRVAFLTGMRPFRTGIYHNSDDEAQPGTTYLPQHFGLQGYRTMIGGKVFHPFPKLIDRSWLDENAGTFGGQAMQVRADDFVDSLTQFKALYNFSLHYGGLEGEKAEKLSDPHLAAWAADRLAQTYDRPFLLVTGFHRPHTPLTSTKEFWDRYDRDKIALPPINPDDLDDMSWPARQVAIANYQDAEGSYYRQLTELDRHRNILKGYLAACEFVDAQIGKVLDALDRSLHRDNTIVVLIGDHGWAIGEHFHFQKWGLWEDTTHIPYVIHAPGISQPGQRSDAGVDTVDLFPTLLELCGLPAPASQKLDGTSLVPSLKDPGLKWERPALTTFGQGNHATRDQRWRYVRWSDGSEELYDHDSDPHEWHNLADRPEHIAVKQRLAAFMPEAEDELPGAKTDHASPVSLTKKGETLWFKTIRPTFRRQPITVKASIGPRVTDGVLLQHGGQSCGYALYIKDGHLCMSLMDVPEPLHWKTMTPTRMIVRSREPLTQAAQSVEGRLADNGTLTLHVDGKEVARQQAKTLSLHPSGVMTSGMASPTYVPVGDYEAPFRYPGDLAEVEVAFGQSIKAIQP